MNTEFCGYKIIHTNLSKNYIEIVGTNEDALAVQYLWNEENKEKHPRIVALNPEKVDSDIFWVQLL